VTSGEWGVARKNREEEPLLRQGERVALGAREWEEATRLFETQGKPCDVRAGLSGLRVNPSRLRARRSEL